MQVVEKSNEGLSRVIAVTIPVAELNEKLDARVKEVAPQMKLKGFRPGKVPVATLLSDITSGVYVTELIGQGVNPVTGDYSRGAAGFLIENGVITRPVAEFTIAGNLTAMFAELTPANDLEFRHGVNVPTLRVEGMTVAGG